ncbi:hypothetical protein AB0D66_31320 [Streptomyces sp. NPDC048270]|uniref:hypothetical protein n=1 Tax=Streptomyces sp. NPDC048270 TaxID=3154615 RepID=UPI0033DFEBCE
MHKVELHRMTGRVIECPIDEMNKPRGAKDAQLRIAPSEPQVVDRTRRHPGCPPRRIVSGPAGDVLVERPDEHQLAAEVHPRPHRVALGVTDVGQAFLTRL